MPAKHKGLHMFTEGLGVISGPILIYIGYNTPTYSTMLYIIGTTTLIIDLYFLDRWGLFNKIKKAIGI